MQSLVANGCNCFVCLQHLRLFYCLPTDLIDENNVNNNHNHFHCSLISAKNIEILKWALNLQRYLLVEILTLI